MIPNRPITDAECDAIWTEFENTCGGVTEEKLAAFVTRLNNTPRVELGGKTPAQEYEDVYGKKPPSVRQPPTDAWRVDLGNVRVPSRSNVRRRRR